MWIMKKSVLLFLTVFISSSLLAQKVDENLSGNCIKYSSYYREYYKQKNYDAALSNWRKVYQVCPAGTRQYIYIDGANLYRWLLDSRVYNQAQRHALVDTLVTINALRAYCYPNFAQEAYDQINNDLDIYIGNNQRIREELLKKIKDIEAYIESTAPEDVSTIADEHRYDIRHRIAILSPRLVDRTTLRPIEIAIIRGEICHAISSNSNFHAFTRSDVDQLLEEHKYQANGLISASDRKQIGVMSGIDEICDLTVDVEDGRMLIEASLIDINSGEITTSTYAYGPYYGLNSVPSLKSTCEQIGRKLVGLDDNTSVTFINSQSANLNVGQPYTETILGLNLEMVYVEGGVFHPKELYVDVEYDKDGNVKSRKEKIRDQERSVYIEPFYIARFPLTQKQWNLVMESTPDDLEQFVVSPKSLPKGDNYPMYNLGPVDVDDFCSLLSEMTGLDYAIPTAEEWEYAALGGRKSRGNTFYSGSNSFEEVGWSQNLMPVGLKAPNALGLYDMSGFLAEYVKEGMKGGQRYIIGNNEGYYYCGESFRVIMRPKKK